MNKFEIFILFSTVFFTCCSKSSLYASKMDHCETLSVKVARGVCSTKVSRFYEEKWTSMTEDWIPNTYSNGIVVCLRCSFTKIELIGKFLCFTTSTSWFLWFIFVIVITISCGGILKSHSYLIVILLLNRMYLLRRYQQLRFPFQLLHVHVLQINDDDDISFMSPSITSGIQCSLPFGVFRILVNHVAVHLIVNS